MKHLAALLLVSCTVIPPNGPAQEPEPPTDNAEACADACQFYEEQDCFEKMEVCAEFEQTDAPAKECVRYVSCQESCLKQPEFYLPKQCE